MGGKARPTLAWVSGILAVTCWVATVVFRFSHPDLTETQLFLRTWPVNVAMVVFFLLTIRWSKCL